MQGLLAETLQRSGQADALVAVELLGGADHLELVAGDELGVLNDRLRPLRRWNFNRPIGENVNSAWNSLREYRGRTICATRNGNDLRMAGVGVQFRLNVLPRKVRINHNARPEPGRVSQRVGNVT